MLGDVCEDICVYFLLFICDRGRLEHLTKKINIDLNDFSLFVWHKNIFKKYLTIQEVIYLEYLLLSLFIRSNLFWGRKAIEGLSRQLLLHEPKH